MKLMKGEVWEVSDRHGEMVIKLMEDINTLKDGFFEAVILTGKKNYISNSYNLEQKTSGKGTAGHIESFRITLCKFVKKRTGDDLGK